MKQNLFYILIFIFCNLSLAFAAEINYLDLKKSSFSSYKTDLLYLATDLSKTNDEINKLRATGKVSPSVKISESIKKSVNEKNKLLLQIKMKNYIYEKVKETRKFLIKENLSLEVEIKEDTILKALDETKNLQPTTEAIWNELQDILDKSCSDDILLILFDKTGDLKKSAANLNRYLIRCQKWVDILIPLKINKKFDKEIIDSLIVLAKDIEDFYSKIPKGIQLKSKSNNALAFLKKLFYKDIIQEIKEAQDDGDTDRVSELIKFFNSFNSGLKILKAEKEKILKSIPAADPTEKEFDLEARMHDLRILTAAFNALSKKSI